MDSPASKTVDFNGKRLKLLPIARVQRTLLYLVGVHALLLISLALSPRSASLAFVLLFFVSGAAAVIQATRLIRALGGSIIWAAVLGLFLLIPFVGLLLLAIIDGHATRLLRQAGVHVGLFGVSKTEMFRLVESSCTHCGYDIRGLPTLTCPECGNDLSPSKNHGSPIPRKDKDLQHILKKLQD